MYKHILVLFIMAGLAFGVSFTMVNIGERNMWPGFSSLTGGFWGTKFLNTFLYALGNPDARRVWPGRFISKLRTDFPKNMKPKWPPSDSDEMDDLNGISQAACETVQETEAGKA